MALVRLPGFFLEQIRKTLFQCIRILVFRKDLQEDIAKNCPCIGESKSDIMPDLITCYYLTELYIAWD